MNRTIRRGTLVVIAIIIIAAGLTFTRYAEMGLDPISCFTTGLARWSGLSFGVSQLLAFSIMLIGVFFGGRDKIGFGTFCNMAGVGFISDGCLWLARHSPVAATTPVRVAALVLGTLTICFGAAAYFEANMGVAPYDALALIITERLKKPRWFRWIRIGTDALCVAGGFALRSDVGAGTLLSVCLAGPLIAFYRPFVKHWF